MTGFSVKPLDETTWPDFARLVERHNGVWGGCWCMAFHAEGVGRTKTVAPPTAAATSKVPLSGRTMTRTPIIPARVASPRRHRTVSPRRKIAVSIIKSGAVKLIAVESVSGRRVVA
jgi:hypothetical protein